MSLICLVAFFLMVNGDIQPGEATNEFFIIWALFAIADALWTRRFYR